MSSKQTLDKNEVIRFSDCYTVFKVKMTALLSQSHPYTLL